MHKVAHGSWGRYVMIWAILCALTLLSFGTSLVDLGAFEPVVALGIATGKTVLVLLFFMHLIEQRLLNAFVPIVCLGYVLLLIGLMVTDVLTRHTFPPRPVPFIGAEEAPLLR